MTQLPSQGGNCVQGMPPGYGDPVQVSIVDGGGPGNSSCLTDTELRASAVPVSLATAPLPSGAATAAKQDAIIGHVDGIEALLGGTLTVTGPFYPATQPISGSVTVSGTVTASGPLTDTQLRATPVPISGTVAVTGAYQATQPVSIAATVAVSGPATDAQLRATPLPVSGTITITPPTLTKGTQGSTGLSVQNLKDAGRTTLAMTAEFAFAQTSETLLTMTLSANGGATSTFSSRVITSGKRLRIQKIIMEVEALGSGTAPQRAYLRMRANTAGATTTSSPIQGVYSCVNNPAVVKTGTVQAFDIPDGFELAGDGTATFGFSLETPDWVNTTATGRAKITVIGFEY